MTNKSRHANKRSNDDLTRASPSLSLTQRLRTITTTYIA